MRRIDAFLTVALSAALVFALGGSCGTSEEDTSDTDELPSFEVNPSDTDELPSFEWPPSDTDELPSEAEIPPIDETPPDEAPG